MDIEQAKKLLELQSCITYLFDEFVNEVQKLDVVEERESLRRSAAEAIGVCACDIISPITAQHPGLDNLKEDSIAKLWWQEARKRRFKHEATKS